MLLAVIPLDLLAEVEPVTVERDRLREIDRIRDRDCVIEPTPVRGCSESFDENGLFALRDSSLIKPGKTNIRCRDDERVSLHPSYRISQQRSLCSARRCRLVHVDRAQ